MILRISRARVRVGKEREFERFIQERALPFMQGRSGLRRVTTGWEVPGPGSEQVFSFATLWDSLDDVKNFAGPDWKKSVVLPDEAPLVSEMLCEHYETLTAAGREPTSTARSPSRP